MNLKNILLILLCTIPTQVFTAAVPWVRAEPSQRNTFGLINRLAIYRAKHSPYADAADDVKRPEAEVFFSLTQHEITVYFRLYPKLTGRYLAAYTEAQSLTKDSDSYATHIATIIREHPEEINELLN